MSGDRLTKAPDEIVKGEVLSVLRDLFPRLFGSQNTISNFFSQAPKVGLVRPKVERLPGAPPPIMVAWAEGIELQRFSRLEFSYSTHNTGPGWRVLARFISPRLEKEMSISWEGDPGQESRQLKVDFRNTHLTVYTNLRRVDLAGDKLLDPDDPELSQKLTLLQEGKWSRVKNIRYHGDTVSIDYMGFPGIREGGVINVPSVCRLCTSKFK